VEASLAYVENMTTLDIIITLNVFAIREPN